YPGFSIFGQRGLSGAISIDSCTFTNNTMTAGYGLGGGVSINAQNGRDSLKVDINHCTFQGNNSWAGGAMSLGTYKTIPLGPNHVMIANITDSKFINNSSFAYSGNESYSGGIDLWAVNSELIVNMDSCNIENNTSDFCGGIGLYSYNGSVVTAAFSDCIISGNHSNYTSGGLGAFSWTKFPDFSLNTDTATLLLTVDNCLIADNQSFGDGAGIGLEIFGAAFADANFLNNEFISNEATGTGTGGGLGIVQQEGLAGNIIASVDSCYFEGNHAETGGGLSVDAYFGGFSLDLTLNQSEFVRNTANYGGGMYLYNLGSKILTIKSTNLSFLQDSALNYGGAIYGQNTGAGMIDIKTENTLVTGNYSKRGIVTFHSQSGSINNTWTNNTF
ncbi:MAG: hypothetical protein KDD63_26255, partial [Bacteroidetes bacterium]|nr:hypothetical protein [Bacteroidota bacterium]